MSGPVESRGCHCALHYSTVLPPTPSSGSFVIGWRKTLLVRENFRWSGRVGQARFVWSIWLIRFVWFIESVLFNQTNETNRINQITIFSCWRAFSVPC